MISVPGKIDDELAINEVGWNVVRYPLLGIWEYVFNKVAHLTETFFCLAFKAIDIRVN